jgi:serine carboxypeptidase-like clade 1
MKLVDKYRILKYSGDNDGVVPTLGTQQWIKSTGWNITADWRAYFLYGQVAGFVEMYQDNFLFATIRGGSH